MVKTTYTGKQGRVKKNGGLISRVRSWTLTETTERKNYVDSDSDGENESLGGNSDSTGSIVILALNDAAAVLEDGDIITVELIMNDGTGRKKTGDIFVETAETPINIGTADVVEQTFSFGQDGVLATV